MPNLHHIALGALLGAVPLSVFAQQPGATPPGLVATTNNPNLAVATVKLGSGTRTSKIVGASVYNEGNEKLGTVDDVILTEGDKATVAIVAIGGVLGVGSKLVALPFTQMRREADKIVLTGVTKEALAAMPSFTY